MKILVLQDYLRSGGTERQSILLSRAFRSAGHEVQLLTFRPGGTLASSAGDLVHRALQPFDFHLDWFAPGLHRSVLRMIPDIVLCMGRMANCRGGSLQRMLNRARVGGQVVATMRTGKMLPWLFRRSLHQVRHVVSNSDEARRVLVEHYGVPLPKISVIRNSLVFTPRVEAGPGRISDRDESLRREYGAKPGTAVMLWVGMFRLEKNQRGIIEIAASLPREIDWQLWFAGEGAERPACEALVEKLGLGERIRFLGFRADPTALYTAADVAVLTSRSESLSNFLIEAHAHGMPSVGYGVTGVVECGGRVVQPEEKEAFLRALLPLLKSLELRRDEGDRVAIYARDHFSPSVQAAAYIDLFRRLLDSP